MDFSKLEQNLIDIIQEQQIKLGYRSETVRLYYPLQSLNRFLSTQLDADGMQHCLQEFSASIQDRLGEVQISHKKDRFCLAVPAKGTDYVHSLHRDFSFLTEFIHAVEDPKNDIDSILSVFRRHSEHVHIERLSGEEFDWLVYFEDGIPDSFRYCIADEGHHIIYHRFTETDYQDLFGETAQ